MVYVINGEQLTRRKLVEIDGSMVTSETGIPLALNIVLPNVKAAGADVRLALLDGTPLAREIECVDVPSTDAAMIHYPFDTVAGTNSQFYVYWGNASLSEPATDSTYGSEAVWSGFGGVWLMNNDPSGSAPQLLDSTSNDRNGTSGGTMLTEDLVNGVYGKNIDFDGTDDCFDVATFTNPSSLSIIVRIKFDSVATNMELFSWYDVGANKDFTFRQNGGKPFLEYFNDGSNNISVSGDYTLSADILYTLVLTQTGSDYPKFYVNGVLQSNTGATKVGTPTPQSMPLRFGKYGTGTTNQFNGQFAISELINTVVSANYILTTHKNLNNPTSIGTDPFYLSIGTKQHQRRTPQFI